MGIQSRLGKGRRLLPSAMSLAIVTWRWGTKYGTEYVAKLKAGVARNLNRPHEFICFRDDVPIPDVHLLKVRDGCYVRLRMFDAEWRKRNGFDTVLCFDLDTVITGDLGPIVDRPEPFVILHRTHFNPCPFNGSVMLLRDGAPQQVWDDFNIADAEQVSMADGSWRGSDQTWIAHKAPKAAGFTLTDGVYGFLKLGWTTGGVLPSN